MNLPQTSPNELYDSLSAEIAQELSSRERRITIDPGTKLVSYGETLKDLIIVNTGNVEISVSSGDQIISLTTAGPGKVLGLRSIISGTSAEVDASALEECSISRISKEAFLEVLKGHPEMYLPIARILSSDLRAAEYRLCDLRGGKERQRTVLHSRAFKLNLSTR